jgi:steroid 5-alpha reductase family enzyme
MTGLTEVLLVNGAVVVAAMTALWTLSLALEDASIVDLFWGAGFVLVAWVTFAVADGADPRRWLLVLLATVWGLRLAGYLMWRNIGKGEDFRYRAMRERARGRFWIISLPKVFLLQGLLMWVVSLPLQAGQVPQERESLAWLAAAGVVAWGIGMFFETVGDIQLARFKADADNAGKVMDRGLWRYTRHPNYFGDFMVWWGIYLVALEASGTWWTIAGPIVMSVLLIRVSGAALLERSLTKRREGYEEYVQRTSGFFPRPPRRS